MRYIVDCFYLCQKCNVSVQADSEENAKVEAGKKIEAFLTEDGYKGNLSCFYRVGSAKVFTKEDEDKLKSKWKKEVKRIKKEIMEV